MSTIEDAARGRLAPPAAHTFKLLEHDGWQALVHVKEDEDHETRWQCVVTIPCAEIDVALTFGAPNEEVARKLFDGFSDPEKVITGVFKNAFGEIGQEQQA